MRPLNGVFNLPHPKKNWNIRIAAIKYLDLQHGLSTPDDQKQNTQQTNKSLFGWRITSVQSSSKPASSVKHLVMPLSKRVILLRQDQLQGYYGPAPFPEYHKLTQKLSEHKPRLNRYYHQMDPTHFQSQKPTASQCRLCTTTAVKKWRRALNHCRATSRELCTGR